MNARVALGKFELTGKRRVFSDRDEAYAFFLKKLATDKSACYHSVGNGTYEVLWSTN